MRVEKLLADSRAMAENKDYGNAYEKLAQAKRIDPANTEVRLAEARYDSWEGKYKAAEEKLAPLLNEYPDNADMQLLQANLDYYQGNYDAAETRYRQILQASPEYADARDGIKRVETARASETRYTWQLDTGIEYSVFSRQSQNPWNNQFVQLTRFLPDKKTAIHGFVQRFDQFDSIDAYYQLGINYLFNPRVNAFILGGLTDNADFRPRSRIAAGGNVRLDEIEFRNAALWLTLDAQQDSYSLNDVSTFSPGLRIEPLPIGLSVQKAFLYTKPAVTRSQAGLAALMVRFQTKHVFPLVM